MFPLYVQNLKSNVFKNVMATGDAEERKRLLDTGRKTLNYGNSLLSVHTEGTITSEVVEHSSN